MEMTELIKRARRIVKPFRVTDGAGFRLKDVDPGDTLEFTSGDKPRAKEALAMGIGVLAELQDMLYADDRWGRHTATKDVPWYVVPADNKWFTRIIVGAAVIDALTSLDLKYPKVGKARLQELEPAKRALLRSE